MMRHFLNLSDAGPDGIAAMLADALDRKAARAGWPKGKADVDAPLAGHVLACVFEKNSTRTRVSFDMAIRQLGGTSIVMDAGSMQLGRGETVADTARILSGYCDAIMIRTDDHAKVEEMAALCVRPRHQRADRCVASLPGHGGPADDRGGWQGAAGAEGRLAGGR